MKPENRAARDKNAMSELSEWAKAFGLDVSDDGCSLCLARNGTPMTTAYQYRRPWRDNTFRSRAAAAAELIKHLSSGGYIFFHNERCTRVACGGMIRDSRTYQFKIPECGSPNELALKLTMSGWRLPDDLFADVTVV